MTFSRLARWFSRPAPIRRTRLRLESLEERCTPATGGLDPGFSGDGLNTFGFDYGGTKHDQAEAVAVQADGKFVVVGSIARGTGDLDFGIMRFHRDGSIDTGFGKIPVVWDLGGEENDVATCVMVDALGRIYVGGYVDTPTGKDFAVCRLTSTGSLDNTFSGDGKLTVSFNTDKDDFCSDMALQGDKLILVGSATSSLGDLEFAICRINTADATLDTTFSSDGKRTVPFDVGGTFNDECSSVAVLNDGTIVMAGSFWNATQPVGIAVCKLNSDGLLHTAFGTSGKKTIDIAASSTALEKGVDMAIQADGKIVLAGTSDADLVVLRLTSTGVLDPSFSSDGIASFDAPITFFDAAAVTVQPDGKIVVAGTLSVVLADTNFFVARLHSDGTEDTTFSADGRSSVDFDIGGTTEAFAKDLVLTPDGIVLIGYTATGATGFDFAITRLIRDQWVVVSADQGGPPTVKIFTPTGTLLHLFNAYGASFKGGVRVATGHLDNDGVPEIFTAPGPGGAPFVNIFNGKDFSLMGQVQVYGLAFTKGVNLTLGNVLGDGKLELLVAPDVGGAPYVNIIDPLTGLFLKQMLVYGEAFTLGVRVTTGDVAGSALKEVLVAPQAGGSPVVNVFDAANSTLVKQIQVFGLSFLGGLYIACGKVNNSGKDDLIVGPGAGGAPSVNVFETSTATLIATHEVYPETQTTGVRVGALDINDNGLVDVLCGAGNTSAPKAKTLHSTSGLVYGNFDAFEAAMTAGLFVAGAVR